MNGRRRLPATVLALGVVSFWTDLASEMIYPLLPVFLAGTLGAGAVALGAIEGAAESVAALTKLASGWWSDRLARRKPLVVVGYALAAAVRPLVAFAGSWGHVLAIRLADRVGKGLRGSPRDAWVADAVDPAERGRAYGFHRAADHAGALVGPLVAWALLAGLGLGLRELFLWALVPGAVAVLVLVAFVPEGPRPAHAPAHTPGEARPQLRGAGRLERRFWLYLAILFLFTLGNSTDAFLLLRATDLGVPTTLVPLLWALHHLVKAAFSTWGGSLSDRWGRRPLLVGGWLLYALVYLGFAGASDAWHVWALFVAYGLFFAATEGAEKALVADLVPAARRGVAFGWYHLAVGLGALPASLLFGLLWQRWGAGVAFGTGAGLAVVAALGLAVVGAPGSGPGPSPDRRRFQSTPIRCTIEPLM